MANSNDFFQDPYIDQATGCFRNRLNISDPEKLEILEVAFSSVRSSELIHNPFTKSYDLRDLQKIHKHLFQDVYDWAGELRKVNLSKGETVFAPCSIIEQGGNYVFKQLTKENYLQNLDLKIFSERAGYYLGEINHLHPFREGNGRTQRTFINQLAYKNGYHIIWDNIPRNAMIQASIKAHEGDPQELIKIIHSNIVDRDYNIAVEFVKDSGSTLNDITKAEIGKTYSGKIIGVTEHYVIQQLNKSQEQELIILHNKKFLSKEADQFIDKNTEISYPYGNAGLVKIVPSDEHQLENKQKHHSYEK